MKEVIKKIQELEAQKVERLDLIVGGNQQEGSITLDFTSSSSGQHPDYDWLY